MSTTTASWLADVLAVDALDEASKHAIRGQDVVVSGRELFGPMGDRVRCLGVDLTPAVEIARRRFTEQEVRQWREEADLEVETEHIHQSGITIIARKR
jgi:hypothetical protein